MIFLCGFQGRSLEIGLSGRVAQCKKKEKIVSEYSVMQYRKNPA